MKSLRWTGDLRLDQPTWALAYATVDASLSSMLAEVSPKVRGNVFGCTSFKGVFSPRGFERGVHLLVGERGDPDARAVLRKTTAADAADRAREAAAELVAELGGRPAVVLLHATPGYEERILEGLDAGFGARVPVYGGSAADDDLRGDWRVFAGTTVLAEGFVLVGFATPRGVHGSFIAGYTPTAQRGLVTAATGRVVHTIDGQPAARVYDRWSGGKIHAQLGSGGVVLAQTSLDPVGRLIDRVGQVPRYLLSHPHEVLPDGSLAFFTDMAVGDELVLMLGSEGSLLDRTRAVAHRALGPEPAPLGGGVLTYCGGCVGAIGEEGSARVARLFAEKIGHAPFVGAATFGEQGCFLGPEPTNRHGNLMCNAVLFDR